MVSSPRTQIAAFAVLFACSAMFYSPSARAAIPGTTPTPKPGEPRLYFSHTYKKPELQSTPLPFTKNDFLRAVRGAPPKTNITLGEPLEVPLRLINHTEMAINAMASTNPRSGLRIMVQQLEPKPDRPRQSFGPFEAGNYAPMPMPLYPFEEYPLRAMVWADLETANGLVFPEPGVYQVRLALQVGAELSQASGFIDTEPFQVTVAPPSPENAEIFEELSKAKAFDELQLRRTIEGKEARWAELAEKYPNSSLTPYLNYALGLYHYRMMIAAGEDNKPELAKTVSYLQKGAVAETPYRLEMLDNLLHVYDRVGDAQSARETCYLLLNASPKEAGQRQGSSKMFIKYIGNAGALDPITYWELLE